MAHHTGRLSGAAVPGRPLRGPITDHALQSSGRRHCARTLDDRFIGLLGTASTHRRTDALGGQYLGLLIAHVAHELFLVARGQVLLLVGVEFEQIGEPLAANDLGIQC